MTQVREVRLPWESINLFPCIRWISWSPVTCLTLNRLQNVWWLDVKQVFKNKTNYHAYFKAAIFMKYVCLGFYCLFNVRLSDFAIYFSSNMPMGALIMMRSRYPCSELLMRLSYHIQQAYGNSRSLIPWGESNPGPFSCEPTAMMAKLLMCNCVV